MTVTRGQQVTRRGQSNPRTHWGDGGRGGRCRRGAAWQPLRSMDTVTSDSGLRLGDVQRTPTQQAGEGGRRGGTSRSLSGPGDVTWQDSSRGCGCGERPGRKWMGRRGPQPQLTGGGALCKQLGATATQARRLHKGATLTRRQPGKHQACVSAWTTRVIGRTHGWGGGHQGRGASAFPQDLLDPGVDASLRFPLGRAQPSVCEVQPAHGGHAVRPPEETVLTSLHHVTALSRTRL